MGERGPVDSDQRGVCTAGNISAQCGPRAESRCAFRGGAGTQGGQLRSRHRRAREQSAAQAGSRDGRRMDQGRARERLPVRGSRKGRVMFAGRGLFVRIFAWFWLTVVATGIALILTFVLRQRGVPHPWTAMLTSTAKYSGSLTIAELNRSGPAAVNAYLEQVEREAHLRACLFDDGGKAIAGTRCDYFNDIVARAGGATTSALTMKFGIARAVVWETGEDGRRYLYATELPFGPQAIFRGHRAGILLEWCVALLVSGGV